MWRTVTGYALLALSVICAGCGTWVGWQQRQESRGALEPLWNTTQLRYPYPHEYYKTTNPNVGEHFRQHRMAWKQCRRAFLFDQRSEGEKYWKREAAGLLDDKDNKSGNEEEPHGELPDYAFAYIDGWEACRVQLEKMAEASSEEEVRRSLTFSRGNVMIGMMIAALVLAAFSCIVPVFPPSIAKIESARTKRRHADHEILWSDD